MDDSDGIYDGIRIDMKRSVARMIVKLKRWLPVCDTKTAMMIHYYSRKVIKIMKLLFYDHLPNTRSLVSLSEQSVTLT